MGVVFTCLALIMIREYSPEVYANISWWQITIMYIYTFIIDLNG